MTTDRPESNETGTPRASATRLGTALRMACLASALVAGAAAVAQTASAPATAPAPGTTPAASAPAGAGTAPALSATGPAATASAVAGPRRSIEQQTAMCTGCHNIVGYQASFPEVYKVPRISGQNAKYIVAALQAYKKGERKHPTMRDIAGSLSEQDMTELASFYEKQGKTAKPAAAPAQPPADVQALLGKMNCASCHGADFNSPIDPSYPKIAGQYADYLYVALKAYQTDRNPRIGRSNAIMSGMAKPYTHRELKAIADYLSRLPGDVHTDQKSPFH